MRVKKLSYFIDIACGIQCTTIATCSTRGLVYCRHASTKVCFEMKLGAGNLLVERVLSITFVLGPAITCGSRTIPPNRFPKRELPIFLVHALNSGGEIWHFPDGSSCVMAF